MNPVHRQYTPRLLGRPRIESIRAMLGQRSAEHGTDGTETPLGRVRWLLRNSVAYVAVVAAAAVIAMVVLAGAYVLGQRGKALRHAELETASLSRMIAEQTSRSMQGTDLVLQAVEDRLSDIGRRGLAQDDYSVHILLESRIASMQHVAAMFVVDAHGDVVNTSRSFPAMRNSVADREYFQFHKANTLDEAHVSEPVVNRIDGKWTLHVSRRLNRPDGGFGGVVVAALKLGYFEELYASVVLDYVSPITLYLADGSLLARQPHDDAIIGKKFGLPAPADAPDTGSPRVVHIAGDKPETVTFRDVPGFPMTIGITNPEHAALAAWRENAKLILIGTAFAAILVGSIALLLVRELRKEKVLAARLLDTGETLQALVSAAMDAIVTVEDGNRIVLFNPAAERMFGYSAREMLGTSLERLIPERHRGRHIGNLDAFRKSGVRFRMMNQQTEIVGLRSNGSEFPIESSISQVQVGGKLLLMAILRDISERRRSEEEMKVSHGQLRELSESLIAVREQEQTRIARELHDELGQQLMRLRLDLSWLSGKLKSIEPELHGKAEGMKDLLSETVGSVRRITTELRPPLLDDIGFSAAALWFAQEVKTRSGIDISTSIEVPDAALDAETTTALFRILQEALTNVVRHADANRVTITLYRRGDRLILSICDDGCGIKPGKGNASSRDGSGLTGIRERVVMLNGEVSVVAGAGGVGTRIDVRVPLQASRADDGETVGEQVS